MLTHGDETNNKEKDLHTVMINSNEFTNQTLQGTTSILQVRHTCVPIRFQSNGWNGNIRFNSRISIGVIRLIIGDILPHGYMPSMFSNSSKTCGSGSSSAGSWSTR